MMFDLDNVLRNLKELGGIGNVMFLISMAYICLVIILHMQMESTGITGKAITTQ